MLVACMVIFMCVLPCAFKVIILGFLFASLSWFKVLQDEGVRLSAPLRQCAQELRKTHVETSSNTAKMTIKWTKCLMKLLNIHCIHFIYMFTVHLGGNASVLQEDSGPHSWMTGHKLPVTTDLSSSQQGFSIQVGEDTEESCTHLQNLWTDHLIGFRRALFMTTRFAVNWFWSTYREKKLKLNR